MIADLLQRAAVIYFHFNSDADIRGGERHSAIRHAEYPVVAIGIGADWQSAPTPSDFK